MRKFIFVCAVFVLCGCKKVQYVPVKEVHTIEKHTGDTLHHHDTTRIEKEMIIREANDGDSAMLARYGIRLKENERLILML